MPGWASAGMVNVTTSETGACQMLGSPRPPNTTATGGTVCATAVKPSTAGVANGT